MAKEKKWENYEQVAQQLIKDIKEYLNLSRVESKQMITGDVTDWEIDVCAYDAKTEKLVAVECKCWSSRVGKETISNLVYCIKDTGAERGIIVSTLELQDGASKIADKENILHITLRKDSDIDNYIAEFINNIFVKVTAHNLKIEVKTEIISVDKKIEIELSGLSTEVDYEIT